MMRLIRRTLPADTRGTTTLEFTLVSVVLMTLLLGGMELGLMMWVRGTLQSVAASTARCAALSSTVCPNLPQSQQYAVSLATSWLGAGIVGSTGVAVAVVTANQCINTTGTSLGTFAVVTITATPWVGPVSALLRPLTAQSKTLTACYPI
jgi:Flp pilus assembly protein TadG